MLILAAQQAEMNDQGLGPISWWAASAEEEGEAGEDADVDME